MTHRLIAFSLLVALVPLPALAQRPLTANTITRDSTSPAPQADLGTARWLTGVWRVEAFGGPAEALWGAPVGGSMMGVFKSIPRDSVSFYEFLVLREEAGTLVLRLKHFGPTLTPWEEKDQWQVFPLVRAAPGELWFDGLTFRQQPDGSILIHVAMRQRSGPVREARIVYLAP